MHRTIYTRLVATQNYQGYINILINLKCLYANMGLSDRTIAGMSFFAAILVLVIGINVAQQLYPGYSVSSNYISDLGATCRDTGCQIIQPSAFIFNSSVFLTGILVCMAAYFIYREFQTSLLSISLAFSGIGAIGVGIFPEYAGLPHYIAAFITFVFGGITLIASYTIVASPLRYFSILLGIATLAALALFISGQYLGLGPGGIERMIVYPFVLGGMTFSGYLMNP